jgi:uncharacterized membrane protein YeaQ/YmgE (transglycosylase-associated protein family)
MHILGGVIIGLIVGRLFATFTLRKVRGGRYSFMGVGVIGSLASDLAFKYLYEQGWVSNFFYRETTIIFEMLAGAAVVCYLLNLFGEKEIISF